MTEKRDISPAVCDTTEKRDISPTKQNEQEPTPPLCEDQREGLKFFFAGHNVFFTGSAGSGKSLLLKHLKYHLRGRSFAFTASTGSASSLIGGQTVNSWAKIGLADKGIEYYTARSKKSLWGNIEVLIIDEISMAWEPTWIEYSLLLTEA